MIKIGYSVIYCGHIAKVIDENKTHVLIVYKNGSKLATPHSSFKDSEIFEK